MFSREGQSSTSYGGDGARAPYRVTVYCDGAASAPSAPIRVRTSVRRVAVQRSAGSGAPLGEFTATLNATLCEGDDGGGDAGVFGLFGAACSTGEVTPVPTVVVTDANGRGVPGKAGYVCVC